MRIGMMTDVYKPHVSGVTHHISLCKRVLEQAGHQVLVFTLGDLDYEDNEDGVVRSPGVPLADTGLYFGVRYTSAAKRKLQKMDVVHVHHPFLSGTLALRYASIYGIPVLFTNHTRYDLYARSYLPLLPEQVSATLLHTYLPRFCQQVDQVIAPSEGVRTVLRDLGVEAPIEVVPNGIDITPFRPPIDPIPRSQLGVPLEDTLLIYTGRLAPEKNLITLLRAFAGAQAAYPNTSLLLLGSGPERDNLQDMAQRSGLKERVVFTGLVPYDELPRYLACADAFVTCSVSEVHPLSVIEALAAGLPVIGIDSPGVGDTIVDGSNGILSSDDLPSYTAKLTRFLGESSLRTKLAEGATASAETYDVNRTTKLLEGVYERVFEQGGKRRNPRWQEIFQQVLDRVT